MSMRDGGGQNVSAVAECAPIAIFAYNRPKHLARLLESLVANQLYADSPVFIFCDGPRRVDDQDAVLETRRVARQLGSRCQIVEGRINRGLGQSIISGVSDLCRRYDRTIVFEDDLVLHSRCLDFLNAALRRYANDHRVYHVNAYRYPLPVASNPKFSRLISSWGWATWQRAWVNFESDASKLERLVRDANLVSAMDFDGAYPYFKMLQNQARKKIDSWAIRWYASVLLRGGLAVCPNVSQVSNHGFDNTGVHCGVSSVYDVEIGTASDDWPSEVSEDLLNYRQTQTFFGTLKGALPSRVMKKLKRFFLAS